MGIAITYKIAEMAEGSKTFLQAGVADAARTSGDFTSGISLLRSRKAIACAEILLVFGLLEAVLWTPRSLGHSLLIAAAVASALWLGFHGHNRKELGLAWPSRRGSAWILGIGCGVAVAIPVGAVLTGHTVPANADWPTLQNIWPYAIWAIGQQFLLQSFFYLRAEALWGARGAVLANTAIFTVAHLPNLPLTTMTFFGALFFTEMFRKYRSIYPLGIVHALLGIAIAYSFPHSLMHHMRVGLSFWRFR